MANYKGILNNAGINGSVHYKSWTNNDGDIFACGISWENQVTITMPMQVFKAIKADKTISLGVKKGEREINDESFTTLFIFIPKKDITEDPDYIGTL